MHMDMIHLLMPDPAVIDDRAEAIARTGLARELAGHCQHLAQRRLVRRSRVVQRGEVHLRDDQEMHRRLRSDVGKSDHLAVLVNFFRRDLAADDFAENATGIGHFFLAAFSSIPEMPSRRCISASTSAGPRPWRASTIMQWNHKSVTSRTRCSRSPPFAARTTSVASSPIFFSMASSPCANSFAT